MKRKKIIVLALVLALSLGFAFGATAGVKVEAYLKSITVYLDDRPLNLTDANGQTVQPLIYNGTTYLPLRAIGTSLNLPVYWEGKTQSVYLGKHSSDVPQANLAKIDYLQKDYSIYLKPDKSIKDNVGDTYYGYVYNRPVGAGRSGEIEYLLNGMYSKISGRVIVDDYNKNNSRDGSVLEVYGDGALLYRSPNMEAGVLPVDFEVDLTGVLRLKLVFTSTNTALVEPYLY